MPNKNTIQLSLILAGLVILGIACKAQTLPTAPPSNPTPVPPTNTSTGTLTAIIPTPSSTATSTISNTPTQTLTKTVTSTITATYPPGTYTPTPPATNTATSSPTPTETSTHTSTATSTPPAFGPGGIAFTSFVQNGSSEFSFVAPNGLSGSQVIYFTNEGYDSTTGNLFSNNVTVSADSTTITESVISYTAPAGGLGSYVPVVISNTGNDPNLLQEGTASGNLTLNHNGLGHKILAFTVSGSVTQYVAGLIFGPDSWLPNGTEPVTFYDSNLPPGLNSTTITDLSGAWNSNNLESLAADGNDNAVLNACESSLSAVVNPTNWVVDANIPKYSASKPTASFGLDSGPLVICANGSAGWTGTLPLSIFPTDTPTVTDTATETPTPGGPTDTPTDSPTNSPTGNPTSTATLTATVTSTSLPSLSAGNIAFTAFVQNGSSEFAFAPTVNLSAGQVIYFTTDSYDGSISGLKNFTGADPNASGNGVTEGTLSYTVGTGGLDAYTQVVISKTNNDPNSLQGGSLTALAGASTSNGPYLILNHNGEGHKIIAYSLSAGVTQYLAALIFGPDTWQTSGPVANWWDSYMPPGLSISNITDLSGLWSGDSLGSFVTQGNDNTVLNSCQNSLGGIVNPLNWAADGNVPTGSLALDTVTLILTSCTGGNAGWTGTMPPSVFPTATPTLTNTATSSNTTTETPTPGGSTSTPTDSPTQTVTPDPTDTPSNSPTGTNTSVITSTVTSTMTTTPTQTATIAVTNSPTATATSGTALNPGDVVIIGYVGNGDNQFAFVPLVNLSAGTVIYFTNTNWDGTLNGGNGVFITATSGAVTIQQTCSFTVGSGGVNAGTLEIIAKTGTSVTGGTVAAVVGTHAYLSLAAAGDQVFAYQGSSTSPSFIAALNVGQNPWQTSGTVTVLASSYLPSSLTNGTNALDLSPLYTSGATENAVLADCVSTGQSESSILSLVYDISNWNGNGAGSSTFNMSSTGMAVCGANMIGFNYTYVAPTATPTITDTATQTATDSPGLTDTPTDTATNTTTSTVTDSPTQTVTPDPTDTPSNSPTGTDTPIVTSTFTNTPTQTVTSDPTDTPTLTATGTITNTPAATNTPTNSATVSFTSTQTSTASPTATAGSGSGSSALNPGDLAITGLKTSGNNGFGFVALNTVSAGTTLYFTDEGWDGRGVTFVNASTTSDGIFHWVTDQDFNPGDSVFFYQNGSSQGVSEDVGGTSAPGASAPVSDFGQVPIGFGGSGDQVFAFQTAALNSSHEPDYTQGGVTFLSGLQFAGSNATPGWLSSGNVAKNTSYLPVNSGTTVIGLVQAGVTFAPNFTSTTTGPFTYSCTDSSDTEAGLLANIYSGTNSSSNWVTNGTLALPQCNITVIP
jgi:hypothetical protein